MVSPGSDKAPVPLIRGFAGPGWSPNARLALGSLATIVLNDGLLPEVETLLKTHIRSSHLTGWAVTRSPPAVQSKPSLTRQWCQQLSTYNSRITQQILASGRGAAGGITQLTFYPLPNHTDVDWRHTSADAGLASA